MTEVKMSCVNVIHNPYCPPMYMQYMLHSDLFTTSILIPHFACQYNQFAGVTNVITVYVNTVYL